MSNFVNIYSLTEKLPLRLSFCYFHHHIYNMVYIQLLKLVSHLFQVFTLSQIFSLLIVYYTATEIVRLLVSGPNVWTEYLAWNVLWQDGSVVYRNRRRYCTLQFASLNCIYEEQDGDRCCADVGQCEQAIEDCDA